MIFSTRYFSYIRLFNQLTSASNIWIKNKQKKIPQTPENLEPIHMSDLEKLTGLIEGILAGSNEVRKQNEETLKQLRQSDPDTYVMTFAHLLNGTYFH